MIETSRLYLREWRENDRQEIELIFSDPEVMQFSDHGTLTAKEQTDWFKKARAACLGDLLSGPLAIVRRSDDRVLGYICLSNDPKRVTTGDAEIGFRLIRAAWSQGYAHEAAEGLLRSARYNSAISRVVAIVDPKNKRSVRVLEKLGLNQVDEVMLEGYDYPDAVYALELHKR